MQVTHSNYDTHNENFDFHLEQVGEFDQAFADPDRRPGRARAAGAHARRRHVGVRPHAAASTTSTAAITGAPPGRSPWPAAASSRDTSSARPTPSGTEVVDRQVGAGHLFHTYLTAVGLDPKGDYEVDGRAIQLADPTAVADQGAAGMSLADPTEDPSRQGAEARQAAGLLPVRPEGPIRLRRARGRHRPALGPRDGGQGDPRGARQLGLRPRLTPDGETFLTGGGDGRLIWWPTAAEKPDARPRRSRPITAGSARSPSAPTGTLGGHLRQRPDGPALVAGRRLARAGAARPPEVRLPGRLRSRRQAPRLGRL